MLQHDRRPAAGGVERQLPAAGRLLAPAVPVVGVQIAVGEHHVQPFHAGTVLELTIGDTLAHAHGDLAVEGGEVTVAAGLPPAVVDDLVERGDDLVDRAGGARDAGHGDATTNSMPAR